MSRRRSSRDFQEARRLARRAHRRQGGKCFWCHEPMLLAAPSWNGNVDPRMMTAEHLVPIKWGGRTEPTNIVAACAECNHGRDAELPRSQLRGLEELRSPFEVLQALKPVLEAERVADEREQELRREMRILARYGQLP